MPALTRRVCTTLNFISVAPMHVQILYMRFVMMMAILVPNMIKKNSGISKKKSEWLETISTHIYYLQSGANINLKVDWED